MQKFNLLDNFVLGVCPIRKTTTACRCCVHAMSDVMDLEAGCDTQTFEHAVMQKFVLLNKFRSGGWFDWTTHDTLSVPHACNVRCDGS